MDIDKDASSHRYWESLPLRGSGGIVLDVKKGLISLVHHQSDCVGQSVAGTADVPARVNDVTLRLNLKYQGKLHSYICFKISLTYLRVSVSRLGYQEIWMNRF